MWDIARMNYISRFTSHLSASIDPQSNNPHHGKGGTYRAKIQAQPKLTKNQKYNMVRRKYKEMPYADC